MIRGYSLILRQIFAPDIANKVVGILYDVERPVFPLKSAGRAEREAHHQPIIRYDESEYQYDLAPSMSRGAAERVRSKKATVAGH
jgi:hypothetical protein